MVIFSQTSRDQKTQSISSIQAFIRLEKHNRPGRTKGLRKFGRVRRYAGSDQQTFPQDGRTPMQWQFPQYAALYILAIAILPILTYATWRRRVLPGARSFAIQLACMAWWACAALIEIGSPGVEAKIFWSQVAYLGIAFAPVFWLRFALDYVRPGTTDNRVWLLLFIVPVLTQVMVWTNDAHGLIWPDVTIVPGTNNMQVIYEHGAYFWVYTAYSYVCVLVGLYLIISHAWRMRTATRGRALSLLAAGSIVIMGNLVYLLGVSPIPYNDSTPLTFAIAGLILFFTLFRTPLFSLVPQAHNLAIESMAEGVLLIFGDGRIADANPALSAILATPHHSLFGMQVAQVLSAYPPLAEAVASEVDEATLEVEIAGEKRIIEVQTSRLSGVLSGRMSETETPRVVLMRDVTEIMSIQQRVFELAVEHARIELLTSFMRDASSAFQMPLEAINTSLARLRAGPDAPPARDLAEIDAQIGRFSKLLDDTLLITTLDSGQPLDAQRLNVSLLVSELCQTAQSEAQTRGIRLECGAGPEPIFIYANARYLTIALRHVLDNALRYTQEGGRVSVQVGRQHGRVDLTIADTGAGMSIEVLARIFDQFFRVSTAGGRDGFGLGLSIAHRVIEMHGGGISVSSTPGAGTTILMSLPEAGASAAVPADAALRLTGEKA
jgi:signal transduction histidine kinase